MLFFFFFFDSRFGDAILFLIFFLKNFSFSSFFKTRLCGFTPFGADSYRELYDRILNAPLVFPRPEWEYISVLAKDFISRTLERNPQKRLSARECIDHPWINNCLKNLKINPSHLDQQKKEFMFGKKKVQKQSPFKEEGSDDEILFRQGLV